MPCLTKCAVKMLLPQSNAKTDAVHNSQMVVNEKRYKLKNGKWRRVENYMDHTYSWDEINKMEGIIF